MSENPTVAEGHIVTIHYTLKDEGGEVIDSSVGEDPMAYLHGAQNVVPGLEHGLVGAKVGDTLQLVVSPEDGYGPRDAEAPPQAIPRSEFPPDETIEPGMMFQAQDAEGHIIPLWVIDLDDENIVIDTHHPLAGVTLHFDVEILDVREATQEEQQHGHPHGPGGHVH